jgi:NYN domain
MLSSSTPTKPAVATVASAVTSGPIASPSVRLAGGSASTAVSHESGPPPPSQPLYFSLPDTGPTDVAVFWDFENVKIPEWCAATKASDCLREKLLPFGRIVERKLYYDSSKKTESNFADRSDLDLSGFTLVDCPSRHRKETLDKKLIVDVLFFAWERVTRGAKATVVLITCDGDYSYTLARLQDIGVYTIIIFRPDNVAQILVDVANVAMAWETDILGGTVVEFGDGCSAESNLTASTPNDWRLGNGTRREFVASPSMAPVPFRVLLQAFLTATMEEMQARQHDYETLEESWALESKVALSYYRKTNTRDKERYHGTKKAAFKQQLVVCGRRDLRHSDTPVVQVKAWERDGFSLETYFQLTAEGMDRARSG